VIWTVVPLGSLAICGACDAVIAPDQPIALLTTKRLTRCENCAARLGFTADAQELDLERFRLEQERIARPSPAPSPVVRVPAPRPMVRAGDLAYLFDPKAAASGRDD
jgi:hypothetical protein